LKGSPVAESDAKASVFWLLCPPRLPLCDGKLAFPSGILHFNKNAFLLQSADIEFTELAV